MYMKQNRIGFKSFMSISVDHSCEAYGLVIEHLQGWKLVFSGNALDFNSTS